MITPDPRLSDRRSRDPKTSSPSPKKYLKNGSAANGEFGVRTTCTDEMFATPLTACPATRVKSGPGVVSPGVTGAGAADAAGGGVVARDVGGGLSMPRANGSFEM